MLSMFFILVIIPGLTVLGLAAGVIFLRHSQNNSHWRKTPCACECCHNSIEVERPVV